MSGWAEGPGGGAYRLHGERSLPRPAGHPRERGKERMNAEPWATEKERSQYRRVIKKRDGGLTCHWCCTPHRRSIEHIVSRSNGGTNDLFNLVAACVECNSGRGNADDPLHCETCLRAHKTLRTAAYLALAATHENGEKSE